MLDSNVRKVRRWAAAMAMATMVVGSGAANGAVFTTNWDPLFNPAFTSFTGVTLGWSGTATINVNNACVSAGATVDFAVVSPCQGAASLIGYGYTLYDTIPENNLFGGGGAGNLSPDPNAVRFGAGGVADGFTLDSPGYIDLFGDPFEIGGFSFQAELDFLISANYAGPRLRLYTSDCPNPNIIIDVIGECFAEFFSDISGDPTSPYWPDVTWTQVPEPASLALVGLALFAVGVARRRRR